MLRRLGFVLQVMFACAVLFPAVAYGQSAFSGIVRDSSGAVLPGVTVEASSPVLIEKVRTVVSDGEGRYTIVDLRPGTYKITFSLSGFATLVRDAVELPGNTTVPINVDLRDPYWKDVKGFRGGKDVEKPTGEWNRMEIVAKGDKVSITVNGVLVNEAFNVVPSRGRIQLQSEGAEIFFRKVELEPLH